MNDCEKIDAVTASLLNEHIYPGQVIAENDRGWGRVVVIKLKEHSDFSGFRTWTVSTHDRKSTTEMWEDTLLRILERNRLTPSSSI